MLLKLFCGFMGETRQKRFAAEFYELWLLSVCFSLFALEFVGYYRRVKFTVRYVLPRFESLR
jgi:hypothetical protein